MIKKLIISALILFFLSVCIVLSQIWFSTMSEEIFTKCLITLGLLIGSNIVLVLVLYHFREESELRKDNFLN